MNELIEKVFKKYEHQITTAKKANYFVGIASDAVKDIIDAHNLLFPHQKQTFTTCNSCVLKILAKLYNPMEQWKAEQEEKSEPDEEQTIVDETVEMITPVNYSLEYTIRTEPEEGTPTEQPKKPKTTNKRRKTARK